MMTDRRLMTCSTGCYQSLREDDRAGLIYGPYHDGEQFISRLKYAGLSGECVYCRGPLPRGRSKKILDKIAARVVN